MSMLCVVVVFVSFFIISLFIEGMICVSCVGWVEVVLFRVEGVGSVLVNLVIEWVDICLLGLVDCVVFIWVVEWVGYDVFVVIIELVVEGMICVFCVGCVECVLLVVLGVSQVSVNLVIEWVMVCGMVDVVVLVVVIDKVGYDVCVIEVDVQFDDQVVEKKDVECVELKCDLIVVIVLVLLVFVLEMGLYLIFGMYVWVMFMIGMQVSWYLQFVLMFLVLVIFGCCFYQKGVFVLLCCVLDMNLLVVVGIVVVFGYLVVVMFLLRLLLVGMVNVYYEVVVVIVVLILFGCFLEVWVKGCIFEVIKCLVNLQVKVVYVICDGCVVDILVNEVQSGDVVEVCLGECVLVDGEVVEGCSYIDELMISGELILVEKLLGSSVVGGMVNQKGVLMV